MLRFSLLVTAVALGSAFSGCSKKEEPAPAETSQPASAATVTPAVETPQAPEIGEDDKPTIRLNLPGLTDAETEPSATLQPQAGSGVAATKPPAVGSKTPAPVAAGDQAAAQPAELVVFYPPFYPLSKRMQGIEGRIDLGVSISETGDVTNVEVLAATVPQFREYAVAAAKDWQFTPARVNGKPVPVKAQFPVPFISEFGSGELSVYSPLAPLSYIDGTIYTIGKDGRRVPANVSVMPLIRVTPAFRRPEGETKPLRVMLNFMVTAEGQVKDPVVTEPSGTDFDQAALTAVKYWQFLPQIRDGKPQASSVKLPIVYGSEQEAAAK
ncbi:MAG: TonB family protein [Opitutaceae bacterium]